MAQSLPAGGTATGGAVFNFFLLIVWKLSMTGKTIKKETKFINRLYAWAIQVLEWTTSYLIFPNQHLF